MIANPPSSSAPEALSQVAPPGRPRRAGRAARATEGTVPSASLDVAATPVSTLKGAGPATSARLSAAGLTTVGELLACVPRAYDDLRSFTPIARLSEKTDGDVVLVSGRIARVSAFPGRFLAVTVADDGDARVIARWFRVPGGMARAFEVGKPVALAGPLRVAPSGQPELLHPTNVTAALAAGTDAGTGLGIRSRYPVVPGVAGKVFERIVAGAVDAYADRLADVIPPATRARLGLPSTAEALRAIHRPDRESSPALLDALVAGRSPAHRRIAIEDLLIVQAGLARQKAAARAQPGRACSADAADVLAKLRRALPFTLTRAQERVIAELQADLATPRPMQRLLVGDVGSGKTAVAFAAAALVAASGGQTLLMAPTEILAEQHAQTLGKFAASLGLRV
ncbi:MAG TPA: DEAD/DEAH box helicase, partial [Polyangia bacterium]|nr:DEAD/DEAH box helicase [Polyangia bacterium]